MFFSIVNKMIKLISILGQAISDAFDWLYHFTEVASGGTGLQGNMIKQILQVLIEIFTSIYRFDEICFLRCFGYC